MTDPVRNTVFCMGGEAENLTHTGGHGHSGLSYMYSIFFPPVFGPTHRIWKFLGWGSNLSFICNLATAAATAHLTHYPGLGRALAKPQRHVGS